jgi:hypothetical protein
MGPCEFAYWHREAIRERDFPIEEHLLQDVLPKQPFVGPEVGRLPGEGGTMNSEKAGEEVAIMASEIIKYSLVLIYSEEFANYFNC